MVVALDVENAVISAAAGKDAVARADAALSVNLFDSFLDSKINYIQFVYTLRVSNWSIKLRISYF